MFALEYQEIQNQYSRRFEETVQHNGKCVAIHCIPKMCRKEISSSNIAKAKKNTFPELRIKFSG